jgi:hypothetical protein
MIEGSCQCRGIQYQYDGTLGNMTVCHCIDCRKAQGTSNAIVAPANTAEFRWVTGSELIVEYESSPGKKRAFCKRCGSPLYSRRDDTPTVLRLRMGLIDTPVNDSPVAHIFASNLPNWAQLDDTLPRHEKFEPTRK